MTRPTRRHSIAWTMCRPFGVVALGLLRGVLIFLYLAFLLTIAPFYEGGKDMIRWWRIHYGEG